MPARIGRKSPSGLRFRGLFSGGGDVSLGRASLRGTAATSLQGGGLAVAAGRMGAANAKFRADGLGRFARPTNAFAPVLGGGRFTQPGADGGECLTHRYQSMRRKMVRRTLGAAARALPTFRLLAA